MIWKIQVNMHSINIANFLANKDRYCIQEVLLHEKTMDTEFPHFMGLA